MMRKKTPREFDYYVLLFFSLAFIGWVWEVALCLLVNHALINRGVYRGPYLPVYGVGGLLLCLLLRPRREGRMTWRGAVSVGVLSALLCCVLEYLTSCLLETRWGVRWWDYSGHFMNIDGRVCLLGAVIFGSGGTALVCVFLPLYEKVYAKIPKKWRAVLCLLFLAVFVADATYCAVRPNTGQGISCSRLSGEILR